MAGGWRANAAGAVGDGRRIKLLGVASAKRYPLLPNVPAISETFAGFEIISYIGFMLPAKTPPSVIATLNKEVNAILSIDTMRSLAGQAGHDCRRRNTG